MFRWPVGVHADGEFSLTPQRTDHGEIWSGRFAPVADETEFIPLPES
jgi:hypothetical protein